MITELIKNELRAIIKACPRFDVDKAEAKVFSRKQKDGSELKITMWLSFPDGLQGSRALVPFVSKLGALRDWMEAFLGEPGSHSGVPPEHIEAVLTRMYDNAHKVRPRILWEDVREIADAAGLVEACEWCGLDVYEGVTHDCDEKPGDEEE